MTGEEIIKGLGEISVCQEWEEEVIEEAIKKLEQEPILDKRGMKINYDGDGNNYKDVRFMLQNFLIFHYDIRPSLAEKTVDEMFKTCTQFISLEMQKESKECGLFKPGDNQ